MMHNPAMLPVRARHWVERLAVGCGFLFAAAFVLFAAGCGTSIDDRPVKWSYISATIIEPSCATVSCHSSVAQRAGVDLHTRDIAWSSLTNGHFVFPGDSAHSELTYLMHAQGSIRMPPDVPLPEVDIDLIQRWIDAGALNN
jgi:hypothetical protein